MIRYFFITIVPILLIPLYKVFAQCPNTSFTTPSGYCIEENLQLTNNSTGGETFEWDFCAYDNLINIPSVTELLSGNDFGSAMYFVINKDNNQYVGFIPTRLNNSIIRINFDNGLENEPIYNDLGNIQGILDDPTGIDLVKEGNNWRGLVSGLTSDKLYLLDFGNNLNNIPSITDISESLNLSRPLSVKIVKSGSNYHAFVINNETGQYPFLRLDFGNSLTNVPTSTEIEVSGSNQLTTIDIIKECDQWFGFVISRSNQQIYRLEFGTDIKTNPTVTEVGAATGLTFNDPGGLDAVLEGDSSYLFIQSRNGPLYKLHFNDNFSNTPSGIDLGNIYGTSKSWGISFLKVGSKWYGFNANFGNKVFRLDYSSDCSVNKEFSKEFEPFGVSYLMAGQNNINLRSFDTNNNENSSSFTVNITSNTAPDIDFSSQNICVNQPTNFTAINSSGNITSYLWDFGDTNTSTTENPSHTYSSSGAYLVTLDVESSNGCGNFTRDTVYIYDEPVPDFSFPAGTLCTFQDITFTNETTGPPDSVVTWSWDFNGEEVSSEKSPTFSFNTGGIKTVRLTASIPGCSSFIEKDISVIAGPDVDFEVGNTCFGGETQFSNLTTGDGITSYHWDFGDGFTSSLENPSHTYSDPGDFDVILTVTNDSGCETSFLKTVTINNLPDPGFTHNLLCAGTETQFNDTSLVENSNITAWKWNFGDPDTETDTSTLKNPVYTYSEPGDYNVKLVTTSTFGCIDSTEIVVSVNPTAEIDFTATNTCAGELGVLKDQSLPADGLEITSWFWEIENNTFTGPEVEFQFDTSGIYQVRLSLTLDNLCTVSLSKNMEVTPPPEVDFTFDSNCAGESITFTDISKKFGVEIKDRIWRFGDLRTSTDSIAEMQFQDPGDYQVSLKITTLTGCTDSLAKTITINDLPEADFTPSITLGGPPLEVEMINDSKRSSSFRWIIDDDSATISFEEQPVYTFTELGTHKIQMNAFNSAGCSDSLVKVIEVVEPSLDVELKEIKTTGETDLQIILELKNNGSLVVENMDIGVKVGLNSRIVTKFNDKLLPFGELSYPLDVSIPSEELNRIDFVCIDLTVNEMSLAEGNIENNQRCIELKDQPVFLEPFPNPAQDKLNVSLILPEEKEVTIFIYNSNGKKQFQNTFKGIQKGLNTFVINTLSLSKGTYFLKVQFDGFEETRQIMIKK